MENSQVRELTLRAIELDRAGCFADAEALFNRLIKSDPGRAEHRLNLGCLYLNHRQFEAAAGQLELVCQALPHLPHVFFNLGAARYGLDELRSALECFSRAHQLDPGDPATGIMLSLCLTRLGRTQQAQRWLPPLSVAGKLEPDLCNSFALALLGVKRNKDAEVILRELIARVPAHWSAVINLANILELSNRLDEVDELLQKVPFERREPLARLLAATISRRRGDLDATEAELDTLRTEKLSPQIRSSLEFEYGKCLDARGRYAEAVTTFELANRLIRDFVASQATMSPDVDAGATKWVRDYPELDQHVQGFAQMTGTISDAPIFLVGFPRSGTTLIDQILDSHPQLQVLEEIPILDDIASLLDARDGGYPMALAHATPADMKELRQHYWSAVRKILVPRSGARLVDKNPLNFGHLQLITALFPGAKLIFVTRHPCDAVLSCFMQNFAFADATKGFWTIDDSAAIYDETITVWLAQRERLQPTCLDLWYEDVVADLRQQVTRLASFLGIPVEESMLEFHQHARKRAINTPSYSQVVKPLYASSVGRWQYYRPWFSKAEKRLLELASRLGYPRPDPKFPDLAVR